jgi:DNA-binding NtrC family response regulator
MKHYHSLRSGTLPKSEIIYDISDVGEIAKPKEILILEDDATFAGQLKETLETEGYSVAIVSNGTEGLKKILATDFSAILCDMVMPNFPGDMFYVAVERVRPHLCKRFIFMTGHQGDRKIEQFIHQIRGLMLWKPFEMKVLSETIHVVTNRQ